MKALCIALFSAALPASIVHAAETPTQEYLWYRQPALIPDTALPWESQPVGGDSVNIRSKANNDSWESQTLPIGNGRMGATVYGGDHLEQLILNEVSLWTGGPNLQQNGHGYEYGPLANANAFGCYQPFGKLSIAFDLPAAADNYTRSLNLKDAIARVNFHCKGVEHKREAFVSHPDDVIVYHATANEPGNISARVALLPFHTVSYQLEGNNSISMRGTLANGEAFAGKLTVRSKGGSVKIKGKPGKLAVTYQNDAPSYQASTAPYITIKNADSVDIILSLATDYKMDYKSRWKSGIAPSKLNDSRISAACAKKYEQLRKAHLADYRKLYNRLSLKLGTTDPQLSSLPTDERLALYRAQAAQGVTDPELVATIYQYGRYVLISGSRPGNLPVNLQGIWNNKVKPAWACDYHNNINLQMCYWGAEVGNLSECHLPLIHFIQAMQEPLHLMTQKAFGPNTPGWTTRISQNPWGGGGWEKWNPPVNAWYALHVWDHYLYTQDQDYLRRTAYPILKNICRFWLNQLKELGENGKGLMSDGKPLSSQEHPELKEIKKGTLVAPNGWSHEWGPVEDGCMHDQQLIRELFDNTAKAAKILGVDEKFAKKLTAKRKHLAPDRIGSGGYLQEWIVDRPDMLTGHRHTSHLIGVFPGTSISTVKTPELAAAAMKSLELRGLTEDNRRSWTWPWRTALWARFGKADKAYEMVHSYICYNVLDNLFGNHPPMQMDGTYGMTGGISEMLLQSHADRIELLPTLPAEWENGEIKGIRARGDISVNMTWKNGKVTNYSLSTTSQPVPVKVVVNGETKTVTPKQITPDK